MISLLLEIDNLVTENELNVSDNLIKANKENLDLLIKENKISNKDYTKIYEEIITALDYTGNLSQKIFDKHEELEDYYILLHNKNPKKANEEYLKHTEKLHKKLDLFKNRCFTQLEKLDETYLKINKKYPPNWKLG